MPFKFNFACPLEDQNATPEGENKPESDIKFQPPLTGPFTKVDVEELHWKMAQNATNIASTIHNLKYLPYSSFPKKLLRENGITSAISQNSDVIPGVYEGGLRLWEGATDLLDYMESNSSLVYPGIHVLEVGCGAGLPGIWALKHGAFVDFQDFNADVLRLCTIINVFLNTDKATWSKLPQHCSFFAGDWAAVSTQLESQQSRYDLILTSETIYNPENHLKLIRLFEKVLKPNGRCLVAAKSYYFGVGGTTSQFASTLEQSSSLHASTVYTVQAALKRHILEVTFKST